MSSFFTRPTFVEPTIAPGPLTAGVSLSVRARRYNTDNRAGAESEWPLSDIPMGVGVIGFRDASTDWDDDDVASYAANLAAWEADLAAAESARDAAKAEYDGALAAWEDALAAVQDARDAKDASRMEVWKSSINLATATRRTDEEMIEAAQTRLTAAEADRDAKSLAIDAAMLAAAPLESAKAEKFAAWSALVDSVRQMTIDSVPLAALILAMVTANAAAVAAAEGDEDGKHDVFDVGSNGVAYYLPGVAPAESSWQRFEDSDPTPNTVQDEFGCIVTPQYTGNYAKGEYEIEAVLTDAVYQAAKAQGLALRLDWAEVMRVYPIKSSTVTPETVEPPTHQCPPYDVWIEDPDAEPEVSYVLKDETISLDDMVQDDTGDKWRGKTSIYSVAAPDAGTTDAPAPRTTITIEGPPTLPSSVAEAQYMGAERFRQGWSEFATAGDALQARRYLTMTASAGEGAPADAEYSGSLSLAEPPEEYVPETYDGEPPIRDGGRGFFDPPSKPLVAYDTLSDAAQAAALMPDSLTPPTDNAAALTPTALTLASPAGLVFTLSDEQTPGDIRAAVDAVVEGEWPVPDEHGITPPAPNIGFAGAINFDAASGNHSKAQKMRFKLTHAAHDSRALTSSEFTTTHHWEWHRRNLDTGAVSIEPDQVDVDWPFERVTTDEEGAETTHYEYTRTDEDWTEVPAPEDNESLELVMLPGENPEPHTFGSIATSLVAAEDDEGGD